MARPRTATNILDARGAFKKNPNRARPNEPKVEAKFRKSPPKRLTEDQRQAWRELVKAVPAGVLTAADHLVMEIAACLLAEFWACPAEMDTTRITRLHAIMARFGLDPSGRASLTIEKPKDNPFDAL